jgi:hypothetical protein
MASIKKKTYYIKNYQLYYLYKDYAISCYEFSCETNISDTIKYGCKKFIEDQNIVGESANIICFTQERSQLYLCQTEKNTEKIQVFIIGRLLREITIDNIIIDNTIIIYDSIQKLEIPENIKTLFVLRDHYLLLTGFSILNDLPYNIENIVYFGNDKLLMNSTNFPVTLKNLYVKSFTDINKLKIPFGCNTIKMKYLP